MKQVLGAAALAIVAVIGTTPAMAQDATTLDTRASDFDGLYAGGSFGYAVNQDRVTDRLLFDTDRNGKFDNQVTTAAGADAFSPGFCHGRAIGATAIGCTPDKDNIAYSGRIGYDRRMNNLVVGALVEGSGNNASDYTTAFSITPASYTIRRGVDYAVSARARAGFTPGGSALFYVTGGGSYARIDHAFSTTNTANTFNEQNDKKMVWGYQAGGGVEVMVTSHVSLGLEYLYSSYNDDKYDVAVGQGTAPATNPFLLTSGGTNIGSNDRLKFHTGQAVINFRF